MKIKTRILFCCSLAFVLVSACAQVLQAQTGASTSVDEKIVSALNALGNNGSASALGLFQEAYNQREQTISSLLKIFNDPNSNTAKKLYAAYYLGALHASEATDSLADQITLAPSGIVGGSLHVTESPWMHASAANALMAIGAPSIRALTRNLAQSDDAKIRELSLQVLARIDGDKDISQLRLQKAVKAESDPQKHARLEAALKSLSESKR